MARKGNQQKNGLDRGSPNQKKGVSTEEIPNGNKPNRLFVENLKEKDQSITNDAPVSCSSNLGDCTENLSKIESTTLREENVKSRIFSKKNRKNVEHLDSNGSVESSGRVMTRCLRDFSLSTSNAFVEWLEKQKPAIDNVMSKVMNALDYVIVKIEKVYPVVLKWGMQVGKIVFLLFMVWLDCARRGIDSFLRMGTTSFLAVIWFSILSVVAMVGISKFLILLAIVSLVGFLVGFTVATILIRISGIVVLWLYGSFWTTVLFNSLAGLAFLFSHERIALFITTAYSVYCVWVYVGWIGLILGLNFSFFSSDALIYFLKNSMNEHRDGSYGASEQPPVGTQGRSEMHTPTSETGSGLPADRSPGVPSTSGSDADITSEDEVVRLLNCTDHYSALGFSRFEEVDLSILKREYRKKAMLVHPDKNMGNEKAAEAFKKLQNAYEVLLDSFKRKTYDDELRRDELLDYFRRFQNSSQKNGGNVFFGSRFASAESDTKDPFGESRQIACKKCGNFHAWFHTNKSKSTARWCQECKDFHQAKDGDGWVEQSSQPLLFGILQKVDAPCAYVCADSKIYDATEWYICQEMRCAVNTHRPSFQVNTSVTKNHIHSSTGKGTNSGQRGGGMPPPPVNMEAMAEEEFVEWLQKAVKAGVFDNFGGGGENPFEHAGSSSKSSGGGSGSKRKKKGKKQR